MNKWTLQVPHPRPRHQVHHQLRQRVRLDRCRDHPHPGPLPEGECLRRTLGSYRPGGLPRPSARAFPASPRTNTRRVRSALQPGSSPSRPRPDATAACAHAQRRRHHPAPRSSGRPHPRVRHLRLTVTAPRHGLASGTQLQSHHPRPQEVPCTCRGEPSVLTFLLASAGLTRIRPDQARQPRASVLGPFKYSPSRFRAQNVCPYLFVRLLCVLESFLRGRRRTGSYAADNET